MICFIEKNKLKDLTFDELNKHYRDVRVYLHAIHTERNTRNLTHK